jgi:hypothetical protein
MSELIEIDLLLVQEGFGTMTWPDGDSYVGAWEGGSREGWGAYYWNNGNSYQVLYTAPSSPRRHNKLKLILVR